MQDPVQEIKSKLAIEDVVASYVTLKRQGKYLKACCPFHQEKTPSFVVSVERQMAYCFGCHKGGDLFQFIQEIEGLDFRGALELLADKANVTLPKGEAGGPKISKDQKERLKAVNVDANKFFVQELWNSDEGAKVLDYMRRRGIQDSIIKNFDVGFAPEGQDKLYRHLLEKKHEKTDLLDSTVVLARDSAARDVVDRFHLRLIFPIDNEKGEIVGFGGRALRKGDDPKYLNSPEYVLYNKGATLYNLSRAKKAIREENLAVVVEGYFDVMASHQAGVENVVACSGTALTESHFRLLKRYSKRVAMAFDSDRAGQEALKRAVLTAQSMGLELFVIKIPSGKDAADAVREKPELWVEAVQNRVPYLDYFLSELEVNFDLSSSSGKRGMADAFLEILQGVVHPVELDHYLKILSQKVGTPVALLYDFLNKSKTDKKSERRHKDLDASEKQAVLSPKERLVHYFLGLVLAYPKTFFDWWPSLENSESFAQTAASLGLVKQVNKLRNEDLQNFYLSFEDFLETVQVGDRSVSSVYKDLKDHYNLHRELSGNFYSSFEDGLTLQRLALEAELKNVDEKLVPLEFEKVITLLYLSWLEPKNSSPISQRKT